MVRTLAYFQEYQRCVCAGQSFGRAKYANVFSRFPYISKLDFRSYLDPFLAKSIQSNSPTIPLVNAILAIGCRLVKKCDGLFPDQIESESRGYLLAAMMSRGSLMGGRATILNIQVHFGPSTVILGSTDRYSQGTTGNGITYVDPLVKTIELNRELDDFYPRSTKLSNRLIICIYGSTICIRPQVKPPERHAIASEKRAGTEPSAEDILGDILYREALGHETWPLIGEAWPCDSSGQNKS